MEVNKVNLEIRDAGSKGMGVFSKVFIPADTIVLEFGGDIVDRADLSKYTENEQQYLKQFAKNSYRFMSGSIDDYPNHSCNPNCGAVIVGNRFFLKSLYDIRSNHEITYDYSTTSNDTIDEWSMKCLCGHIRCRKLISGWQYLTDSQKQHYISLGVVPNYLIKG